MSADNWTYCPKCKIKIEKENHELLKKLYDQYGKIHPEEWERMERETKFEIRLPDNTFREDYEIGVSNDGKFTVNYSGSCKECKLSFNYKYVTIVDLGEK